MIAVLEPLHELLEAVGRVVPPLIYSSLNCCRALPLQERHHSRKCLAENFTKHEKRVVGTVLMAIQVNWTRLGISTME